MPLACYSLINGSAIHIGSTAQRGGKSETTIVLRFQPRLRSLQDSRSFCADEDLRLNKCQEKELVLENGSISANGMVINERGGWGLSERTKEDSREKAGISGKQDQLGLGKLVRPSWEEPKLLKCLVSDTLGENPIYQVFKYFLSCLIIVFWNGFICALE